MFVFKKTSWISSNARTQKKLQAEKDPQAEESSID